MSLPGRCVFGRTARHALYVLPAFGRARGARFSRRESSLRAARCDRYVRAIRTRTAARATGRAINPGPADKRRVRIELRSLRNVFATRALREFPRAKGCRGGCAKRLYRGKAAGYAQLDGRACLVPNIHPHSAINGTRQVRPSLEPV